MMSTRVLAWWLALALPAQALAQTLRDQAQALLGSIDPVSVEEAQQPTVELGRALFWDERLSADGKTACASCHVPENWGSDPRPRSPDARGNLTTFHSLTVFNAQQSTGGQRWLADRPSGADQAIGSITGSMGFDTREDLLPLLAEHGYAAQFARAFPDAESPLSIANYGQALEDYQATLRTPADFDAWLSGDDNALSAQQQRGLQRFMELGCVGCHNGPLLGGGALQRFGVLEDYWEQTGSEDPHEGLIRTTGKAGDEYRFRVPPLRNVAKTPPYFHDGSVPELERAVTIMAKLQLGQSLSEDDTVAIVAFLAALSGEVPSHFAPPN